MSSGTFDITSGDSWAKIGVSSLAGGLEGALVLTTNPAIIIGGTAAIETGAGIWKDMIDGEEFSGEMFLENLTGGVVSGLLSFGLGKLGDGIDNLLAKYLPKLGGYFDDFLPASEIEDVLDWLIKYGAEGHPDSSQAVKWVRQYIERKWGQNALENWTTGNVNDWICKMLFG